MIHAAPPKGGVFLLTTHNCVFQMSNFVFEHWIPQGSEDLVRLIELEDDLQMYAGDPEYSAHKYAEYQQISRRYA